MVIKILLIISIILQLGAASVAIGMIQKTKYNLSWMLFTVALTGLACLRFGEYVQMTHMEDCPHREPAPHFRAPDPQYRIAYRGKRAAALFEGLARRFRTVAFVGQNVRFGVEFGGYERAE